MSEKKRWKKVVVSYFEGFGLEIGGDPSADTIADAADGTLDAADGAALLHAEDIFDADEAQVVDGHLTLADLVLPQMKTVQELIHRRRVGRRITI